MSIEVQSKPAAEEKNEILQLLRAGREQVLSSIDAIAPAFCEQSCGDGRWTVLQCMEHVVNAEEGMPRLWLKLAQPGTEPREKDTLIRDGIFNGITKRTAPERVVPLGKIRSVAEARDRFIAARAGTIALVEQVPAEELRSKVVPHPVVDFADGYQLFLIMALHANQHARQMTEIAKQLTAQRRTA